MRRTVLFSLATVVLLAGGLVPRLVQGDSTSAPPLQVINIAAQAQKDGSLLYRICVISGQSSVRGDVTLAATGTGATTDIVLSENGYSCGLPNSYLLEGSQTFGPSGQNVTYQFVQACVVDASDVLCLSRNQPLLGFGLTVFPDCSIDVSVNSAGLAIAPTVILPCVNGEGSLTSTLALTATPTPTETAASCALPSATATGPGATATSAATPATATVPATATGAPTGLASATATATSPPPTQTPTATPRPPTATPTSFGTPIPLPWEQGASPHMARANDQASDATATVTGTVPAPLPQCTATDTPVAATATLAATAPAGATASATAAQATASSQGPGAGATSTSAPSAPAPTNTPQPPATSTAPPPAVSAVGTVAGGPPAMSPTRTAGTGGKPSPATRLLVTLNAYELRPRDILLIHVRYRSHTAIQATLTYAAHRSVRVSGRTGSKGLLTLRLRVPKLTLDHGRGSASLRVVAVPTALRATYATRITLSDMILSTRTARVKACKQQLTLHVAYYAKARVQLSVSYLNRRRVHITTGTDRHGNLVRKVALSYLALKPDKLLVSVAASGRHGTAQQTERSQLLVKVPAACRST